MPGLLAFHQGKTCDAVLRRIERRERARRSNMARPELSGEGAPIDFACQIGETLFALEHTGIEPFEGHMRLEALAGIYLKPIEAALTERLQPLERVVVTLPWNAFQAQRGGSATRLREAVVQAVVHAFAGVPIDRPGHRAKSITIPPDTRISFPVSVSRSDNGGHPGRVIIACKTPNDLEEVRFSRLERGYLSHAEKLTSWREAQGARTVLVLEDTDIQATREDLVADALRRVEQNTLERPDEVWLVSTAIPTCWHVAWLRIGDQYCHDLSYGGPSLSEAHPQSLVDLTGG